MSTRTERVVDLSILSSATRTERLLWWIVGLSLFGDVVTTFVGLHLGLAESNPIARTAIDVWGVFGMLALKVAAVAIALTCRRFVSPPYRSIVPAALAIPWSSAVIVNLYMLSLVI